jgi:adenylylsulfate kinase-like enzyme
MVIWIIGLPGSGKTTLAKALQNKLNNKNIPTVHIDGDDMRTIWGEDIGYKLQDREKNSLRIQKLCSIFEKQGLFVIASIMSIFPEHRKANRKLYKNYFEVFLDIDINILKTRREIYQKAINKEIKNVVGVDIEYIKPTTYDIKFDKNLELEYLTDTIIDKIGV